MLQSALPSSAPAYQHAVGPGQPVGAQRERFGGSVKAPLVAHEALKAYFEAEGGRVVRTARAR